MTLKQPNILSIQGQSLKLNTRADVEPLLRDVDPALVEEVHLGGNTIGVEAAERFAEFLQKATSIKIADLADIFTGRLITEIPQALSAICDALKDKTSLVEINLSDNAFGGRSVDPMVPFLMHNRSFQVLKLNNNGLGPAGGSVVANALLDSAQRSKKDGKTSQLRTVICGRNRLEDGSAPIWAAAFAAHGTLVEVRMPQNGIRQDGVIALARGLSECPGLQTLDLQDNAFNVDGSDEGARAMAESLKAWPDLDCLDFSDCVLSNKGEVPAVLTALASGSNPKLHTLKLQNNNLEANSFALLADIIGEKLPRLQKVELQWNEVEEEEEAVDALADVLKARGGRLVISDEDEEESDEVGKEEEDELERSAVETVSVQKPPSSSNDNDADDLANLLSNVSIKE